MRIAVYGGGAVGLGIASCLLQSRNQVDVVARRDTLFALEKNGLERTGIFGEVRFEPKQFGRFIKLETIDYDFIVVCVKSFDSAIVAEEIADIAGNAFGDVRIVQCQNGWGNAEIFAERFPHENVFSSRIITGFRRLSLNRVDITVHAESIHFGSLFTDKINSLNLLAQAIDEGGIPCRTVTGIEKDIIAKLLYNCALNPLGAIFGVPYGILGESEKTRGLMLRLVEEVFFALEGVRTTHWATADEYMTTFYNRLLPLTSEHESSMLQDLRAGKKTEIDAISGAVVRMGLENGVQMPCNSMVYDMIKFMEERYSC